MRMKTIAYALILALTGSAAAAPPDRPVGISSEQVVRALDALPHARQYVTLRYESRLSRRARNLVAACSGGIDTPVVTEVLGAIQLESWWEGFFSSPWRLEVHGDATNARVTVLSGECGDVPLVWLLRNVGGTWHVIELPRFEPCTPVDTPDTPVITPTPVVVEPR
jgi:hypothetical protein